MLGREQRESSAEILRPSSPRQGDGEARTNDESNGFDDAVRRSTLRKKVSHVSRREERGWKGRLGGNKEPPADELIFPDDSRGYSPAGV